MDLYPKMASRLEQNLRLKTLGYLLFIPANFFYLLFGCYRANVMKHPILITAFGLSVFGPELEWEGLGLYT